MGSIPVIGTGAAHLTQIEGSMPGLTDIPAGCAFHPRCPRAMARCAAVQPEPRPIEGGQVAYLLHGGGEA